MIGNQGFLPATMSVKHSYSDRKLNIKDLKNDTLMTNRISLNIAFSTTYQKHILASRVENNAV